MKDSEFKDIKGLYYFIGGGFSILGLISGIVLGITLKNFLFCILDWVGTFLFVTIYFGIGVIIENQSVLFGYLNTIYENTTSNKEKEKNNSPTQLFRNIHVEKNESNEKKKEEKKASANEWRCPKCGKINQNYVGTCGCGELKP